MQVRGDSSLWIVVALLSLVAGCNPIYLGVQIEEGSGASRSAVLINAVTAGSPAGIAGLDADDVIVSVDRRGVTTVAQLRKDLSEVAINTDVRIKVYRGSTVSVVDATVNLTADPADVPTSLGINIKTSAAPVGVEIVSVEAGSAADEAGLLVADVINKFGSTAIASVDHFRKALALAGENANVTVTFRRGLAATDDTTDVTIRVDVVSRQPLLGTTTQDLSAELAERLGYPALGGVRATAVLIGGAGFDAGIMPGDLIFSYGGTKVEEVSDLATAVRGQGGSGTVAVGHSRGGDILTANVVLRGDLGGGDYTLDVGVSLVDDEDSDGLIVVEVVTGGFAEGASLQVDDLVTAIEGNPTTTPQEFYRQINAALDIRPSIDGVSLSTIRNGVAVSRYMRIRSEIVSTSMESIDEPIPYGL